ncbi:hypothetical protein BK667_27135 [Pseudomonas frederiksbergensis]|uniref:Uncharacterized protein n=1 Tax=Pseudomonas frederiksbergensis TaxID=104087 RepID=A0A423JYM2_9PSED|nr:hypothetical protein BK666_22000 [Pseudomonas frederiksbergensis]RON44539.1 hypothetical protein BK667_27135 [Pseudomonas frederiksbergensis]
MSRSLGLREDQREGEVLATLIIGLFPLDSVWCLREQARSHRGTHSNVGASLLAKRPEQSAKI